MSEVTITNQGDNAVARPGESSSMTVTFDEEQTNQKCNFYNNEHDKGPYRLPDEDICGYECQGAHIVVSKTETSCTMLINHVNHKHNGTWTFTGEVDDLKVTRNFDLIVAKKPTEVYLVANNENIQSPLSLNLTYENQRKVQCVAKGDAYPYPRFQWFVLSTENIPLNDHNVRAENDAYISELTYYGELDHNEKVLKCVVEQEGYTNDDKDKGQNTAQVTLEIVGDPPTSNLVLGFGVTVAVLFVLAIIVGGGLYVKRNHLLSNAYEPGNVELQSNNEEEEEERY